MSHATYNAMWRSCNAELRDLIEQETTTEPALQPPSVSRARYLSIHSHSD